MAHVPTLLLLALVCTCVASVSVRGAPSHDGLAGRHIPLPVQKTPRIRGGVPVAPGEIPYAAGLMIQQPIGNRWCGGSLISLNYVLTAANCFLK